MIKANDLRIGNKVFLNTEEGKRIITVSYHEISYAARHSENRYEPIPLTSEILIKSCGFHKYGKGYVHANGDSFIVGIRLFDIENNWWVFGYDCTDQLSNFFTSLHQLQNLYHSLTGTELTLNLCTATTQNDTH